METLWTWVAAGLTLAILSFLYRDNPAFKVAEHLFIGPAALGLMMWFRFSKKLAWVSRWPLGFMVGVYSGLAVIGFAEGDLMQQVGASIIPPIDTAVIAGFTANPGVLTFLNALANPIIMLGLICILLYFFFSLEHKGL